MRYVVNEEGLKKMVLEQGYKGLTSFSRACGLHRNTLTGLVRGKSVFLSSLQKIAERLKVDPLELIVPVSLLGLSIPNMNEIRPVVAWLLQENKEMAVVLLGSRASGRAKRYSDWDLGIFSHHQPIGGHQYLRLKRRVEEMTENLVRIVDLVNLNQAPAWFLKNLQIVYLDGDRECFIYLRGLIDGIEKNRQAA